MIMIVVGSMRARCTVLVVFLSLAAVCVGNRVTVIGACALGALGEACPTVFQECILSTEESLWNAVYSGTSDHGNDKSRFCYAISQQSHQLPS